MANPRIRFKREDGTEFPARKFVRIDEMAEINPKSSTIPEQFYYMDLGSVSMGLWQDKAAINKENAPSRANRLANCGDVFFQSVRPYNMGHYYLSQEFNLPVVTSTGFIQLRARKGYCNAYIYQLLYEDRFNAEVNIRCTGSNYPAINSESFSNIEIMSPCLEEQQKIADFLSSVDEVIAQSEAEVSNLQQQKKAAMQKIFSQEVRFKREDGSDYPKWNSSQISELFNISAGGDIDKANSSIEYSIEYPYAVYANALTNNGLYGYANYYKIEQDCFTVTGRGDVGCAIARHEKFVPIVRLLVCEPKHNENVDCFAEIVNNTDILVESTGVPQLTSIQLGKIRVSYPIEIEEQQKIADFLSAYDEAISYAKQELDKWRELKKGLLQQMFV